VNCFVPRRILHLDSEKNASYDFNCMTHYTFPIAIEREDGQYYAYSEDLPGVYGLGATIEDAKESILEGIRIYILECKKDGRPVPTAHDLHRNRLDCR